MTVWQRTILFWIASAQITLGASNPEGMVSLPGGLWQPPFETKKGVIQSVKIAPFLLDTKPVTAQQFFDFTQNNPQWARNKIADHQADSGYLKSWQTPSQLGPSVHPRSPVVDISWFAARAYCQALGKRLPTEAEWEWAATQSMPQDKAAQTKLRQEILNWYAKPNTINLPAVGRNRPDRQGLYDLYGLVWEWVEDFNGSIVNSDSRGESEADQIKFCGSGSMNAKDREDYPVFMRFAFRSSLKKGNSTTSNLGFRCARSEDPSFYDQSIPFQTTRNQPLAWNTLQGSAVWIAMFYASCNFACPLLLQNLKVAWEKLPKKTRAATQVVLVTFDSEKDTPQRLAEFAKHQAIPDDRWILASGNSDAVRTLAVHLGISYRRMEDGEFAHASIVTLLDKNGKTLSETEGAKALTKDFLEKTRAAAK